MDKAVMILERQGNLMRLSGVGGLPTDLVIPSEEKKRGLVSDFSSASRRRLGRLLATVEPHQRFTFLTLTYPKDYPDAMTAKQHLRSFMKRLTRIEQRTVMIWKLEFQTRGAPHFHLILMNFPFVSQHHMLNMWREVTRHDVKHLHIEAMANEPSRAFAYIAKYTGKAGSSFTLSAYLSAHPGAKVGRVWGMWGKEFIRFAPYKAALLIWDVHNMKEFFRSFVEKMDTILGIEREYDPKHSATYFMGRLIPADAGTTLDVIVDEIAPGLVIQDIIRDFLEIEDCKYSMALNLPEVLDAEEYSEIPF